MRVQKQSEEEDLKSLQSATRATVLSNEKHPTVSVQVETDDRLALVIPVTYVLLHIISNILCTLLESSVQTTRRKCT
jgi:hypothetical protein